MLTLIYAHPYPLHSRVNRALRQAVEDLQGVRMRDLYALYPDFHIDAAAEQAALAESQIIVLQHPMRWYHTPALLSLWFEKVLAYGWAYGHDPAGQRVQALQGKRLLWTVTTGGAQAAYSRDGYNQHTVHEMGAPIRQTALYCGMEWLEPHIVYGTGQLDTVTLAEAARSYRGRLVELLEAAA
ncbi:glutathione-regulated potassium-efflux system oxidoreductase KefF [Hylemonella gracilis]|uniref:Glutathione-regulated potassium-efflux system ancillary protein KefF n=1 Tax=Hylemonella gracilis ATCC 19624 TaxID=887062 RepID=F3KTG8_9BURK|nr:NAD(P)H-dependent oxidoreductase [Hylemonella gracilis]EGI76847.1 glutathione-regulated potassium-efflux system ancillary protein KefF [Hylemonella gracilis ATCC 19624]